MAHSGYPIPSAPTAILNDQLPPPPKYKQRNNIKGQAISTFMNKYNLKKNLLIDENFCQIDDYNFILLIDDSSSMNVKRDSFFSKWECNKNIITILFEFLNILNGGSVDSWFLNRDDMLNNGNLNNLNHSLGLIPFGRTTLDKKLSKIFDFYKATTKKKFIIILSDGLSTNDSGKNKYLDLKNILKERDSKKYKVIFVLSEKNQSLMNFKYKNVYFIEPFSNIYNEDYTDTDSYTQADYCVDIILKGLIQRPPSFKKKLKKFLPLHL
jgi:hypothetical protein